LIQKYLFQPLIRILSETANAGSEASRSNLVNKINDSAEELWTMYNASRLSIWENMEYDEILRINDFVQTGMIEELSE